MQIDRKQWANQRFFKLSVSQLTAARGSVGVGQFMYYGNEKKVSIVNHENLIAKAVHSTQTTIIMDLNNNSKVFPIWWSRQSLELEAFGEN